MVVKLMLLLMKWHEPSMNKKFPPPVWAEWKLAGLPFGALTVYWRLWTKADVMDGRKFWQPARAGL